MPEKLDTSQSLNTSKEYWKSCCIIFTMNPIWIHVLGSCQALQDHVEKLSCPASKESATKVPVSSMPASLKDFGRWM